MARNRCGRRAAALTVLVAALAGAPGASAAEPRVPSDAPVVAGPTASGGRLVAFDRGRRLCTAFLGPRESRRWAYPDCELPSQRLRDVNLGVEGYPHRTYHHGVVRPEVAEAEIVFRDGKTARAPTSAGQAYTGRYAGKVRFLLVEKRNRGRFNGGVESYIRLFGADGALLGIATDYVEPERARPAKELRRGMTGGAPWSLRAYHQRALTPLPGNEERFVDEPCVEVWRRGPAPDDPDDRSLVSTCLDADNSRDREAYALQQHCGRIGIAAVGVVEEDVRAVVAVLGDGTKRRATLSRLPPVYRGGRAFALVLPRDTGLRRLVELTGGGGREVIEERRGPGAVRCGDQGLIAFYYDDESPSPTGPVALTVYDDGPLLCATLGLPTRSPGECGHPPLDPLYPWILDRRAGKHRIVAGVLPAEVVRVVVEMADGKLVSVDTATTPYAGQYAGQVRFFTVSVARRARIAAFRLYDALGRRVATRPGEDTYLPAGPALLVVGGPPGLRLFGRRFGARDIFHGYLCVRLGGGRCGLGYGDSANVRADCHPKRLVFWGLLPRNRTAVTVETDRGEFAARVRRLPRALRDRPRPLPRYLRNVVSWSAFVAVVPARARPTALVISGRRTSTRRLRLPSAAEQCGYDDFLA